MIVLQLTLIGESSSNSTELGLSHYQQVIVSAACKETPGGTVTMLPAVVIQSLPAPIKDALTQVVDLTNQQRRLLQKGKQKQVDLLAGLEGKSKGGEGEETNSPLLTKPKSSGKQVSLIDL